MDTMTKKLTKGTRVTVVLGRGEYGTAQPQIELRFPPDRGYRARKAALLTLAADVERATPPADHWCVELVDGNYETGKVYLDLIHGTDDEAERGMAVLREVVA